MIFTSYLYYKVHPYIIIDWFVKFFAIILYVKCCSSVIHSSSMSSLLVEFLSNHLILLTVSDRLFDLVGDAVSANLILSEKYTFASD